MNRLPNSLANLDPTLRIDIFTRLQDDDPYSSQPVKKLDGDPQVRLIRLPCGPTDRYVPKEILYGEPIAEFASHIEDFAREEGIHYDVLHGHYADGWETVTVLNSRWPHHPPALLTTHSLGRRKRADGLARGEGSEEELDQRYNFPTRIESEERSLEAAARILPLSTPEANILAESYSAVGPGDPRVTVVPNGIDPADFRLPSASVGTKLREELGVGDSAFLLLVPSRVDPRKGQANLLQAMQIGKEILAGKGLRVLFLAWPDQPTPYSQRLEEIIAGADLADWVIRHPPIAHERMPDFFAAADGVALPSQEYFSIAMLETMLLERPLIASTHSSGVDVIKNGVNGLLVDHTDVPALSATLTQLLELSSNQRAEMGSRARARVLEGYTWDSVAARLLGIYEDSTQ
jgi:glycosyltransferase involved in cell wall biosynthesis